MMKLKSSDGIDVDSQAYVHAAADQSSHATPIIDSAAACSRKKRSWVSRKCTVVLAQLSFASYHFIDTIFELQL